MRLAHAFCVHLHTPGPNPSPTAHDPQHNAIPHPAEYVCPTRPFCFYLGRQIFTHAAFYNQSFRIVTGTSPSLSPNSCVYLGSCRVRVRVRWMAEILKCSCNLCTALSNCGSCSLLTSHSCWFLQIAPQNLHSPVTSMLPEAVSRFINLFYGQV